jgi:hypothetical protein
MCGLPALFAAFLAIAVSMMAGCMSHPRLESTRLDVPVDSSELVPVEELNRRIEAAEAHGLDWPRYAAGTALAVLDYEEDARCVELKSAGNRGEVSDTVVVVLVRDRFKDDSIRGDWHRAVLYRTPEGTWRFSELRRAFRCYRGKVLDRYSRDLCP